MNNEQLVNFRNGIVIMIENACGYNNDDVLDRKKLARVLTRIANTKGFNVDLSNTDKFWEFGKYIDTPHIKITDSDGFLLRIIKTTTQDGKEVYRTLYDDYYLRTDEENAEIARFEIEADRKMSLYNCGYRDF